MDDLSTKMIVFLAILVFVLVAKAIDAYEQRGISRKSVLAAQQKVAEQLKTMQSSLTDVGSRLTSIEDVLKQVE
jgi:hypothetical protein